MFDTIDRRRQHRRPRCPAKVILVSASPSLGSSPRFARLSDPQRAAPWAAARLARQRRHDAEAARVIERLVQFLRARERQRPPVRARARHRATARTKRPRQTVRQFMNAPARRRRGVCRAARPKRSTSSRTAGARARRRRRRDRRQLARTQLEHRAVAAAGRGARATLQIVADRWTRPDRLLDRYEALLTPRTRLVALAHVSNALGTVLPLAAMIALAHRHGARVFVDGAQAAAHVSDRCAGARRRLLRILRTQGLRTDGIGALYVTTWTARLAPPWQFGGHMVSTVSFERHDVSRRPSPFRSRHRPHRRRRRPRRRARLPAGARPGGASRAEPTLTAHARPRSAGHGLAPDWRRGRADRRPIVRDRRAGSPKPLARRWIGTGSPCAPATTARSRR